VAGGTLPTGLTVTTATGVVSGTPSSSGTYTPVFSATDRVTGATASRTLTLVGTATAPTITTASLPNASTTSAYSQTLAVTTAPSGDAVTWMLVSSTLPSGLSLNGSTGVISGTPTSTGPFPITVQATDTITGQTAQRSYTLTASSAVAINATISASANNVDFRAKLIAAGWDGVTPVNGTVTINSGVWIGSSSTAAPALTIAGSFPSGSALTLINNGHVSGAGGAGGHGGMGSGAGPWDGLSGYSGGPAIQPALRMESRRFIRAGEMRSAVWV